MTTLRAHHGNRRTLPTKALRKTAPERACQVRRLASVLYSGADVQQQPAEYAPKPPKSLVLLQRALDDRAERTGNQRAPLLVSAISHLDIDEVQMFADFFEKYVPAGESSWRQTTYLGLVTDLAPATQLLKRAKRTIGLTHLAALSGDERLVREARISYARLLGQLQLQLAFPVTSATVEETRELAVSIALMTHMSDPELASPDGDDDWVTHFVGAQKLLSTYGPSRMNTAGRLNEGVLRHVLHNGFSLAVAKRKAWNVDTSWFQHIPSKGWTTYVTAFCKLPELLETTDRALAEGWKTSELLELVERLHDVERQGVDIFPEITQPGTVNVSVTGSLSADVEEHCVITGSTTFPELFVPMSPDHPKLHRFIIPTHLLLMTACTVLRIWHLRPDSLSAISDRERHKKRAYLLARKLCMSAISFTQSSKLVHIQWLRFALSLARNVFEQQSAVAELGWCDGCLIANQMRSDRIRRTIAPTLCKLEDITPGMAEAGRYKSKFDTRAFVVR
ncbi:hypothetical protein LTR22_027307, partial [Elasticomyces elasticus]